MQGKLLMGAMALLLICSLAGCRSSTAAVPDWGIKLGGNAHSVLERDGAYDGTDAMPEHSRGLENRRVLLQNTPNSNDHLNNTNTKGITNSTLLPGALGETVARAGEQVKDSAENAANDLKNAMRRAAS